MYSVHYALLVNKLSAELCCLNIITFCMVCNPYNNSTKSNKVWEANFYIMVFYGVFNFILFCQFALIMSVY